MEPFLTGDKRHINICPGDFDELKIVTHLLILILYLSFSDWTFTKRLPNNFYYFKDSKDINDNEDLKNQISNKPEFIKSDKTISNLLAVTTWSF